MALTVADIVTRVGDILHDADHTRWPADEIKRYLNDGRREMCVLRPDIYATTSTLTLSTGPKQAIPSDGVRLIDVVCNMAGDTRGSSPRIVERELLDAHLPNWQTKTASTAVKHFMYDERNPEVFYVYPPAASGAKLEIVYSQLPTDVSSDSTQLTVEEAHTGALVDYICYRALSKDADFAANLQRAAAHYQQFMSQLGFGKKGTYVHSPNTSNVGGQPPRTAMVDN